MCPLMSLILIHFGVEVLGYCRFGFGGHYLALLRPSKALDLYSDLPAPAARFSLNIIATACFWLSTLGPFGEPLCSLPLPHFDMTLSHGTLGSSVITSCYSCLHLIANSRCLT